MVRLHEILNEMHESKFFKRINVHFGAKTRENVSYLEEFYNQQLEYLNLSLDEEKAYLKGIIAAKDEREL